MRLSKEETQLLRTNQQAFLVKAYLSIDATPTIRECAEYLGLSRTTCHRLMLQLGWTPSQEQGANAGASRGKTAKTAPKAPQVGTAFGTAFGTLETAPAKGNSLMDGTIFGTAFGTSPASNQANPAFGASPAGNQASPASNQASPNDSTDNIKQKSPLTLFKDVFDTHYYKLTGQAFYWEAKHVKALEELMKKIVSSYKGHYNALPSISEQAESLRKFLECINNEWILRNFSPVIINSKYNEIISDWYVQRQTNTNKSRATTNAASMQDLRNAVKARISQ